MTLGVLGCYITLPLDPKSFGAMKEVRESCVERKSLAGIRAIENPEPEVVPPRVIKLIAEGHITKRCLIEESVVESRVAARGILYNRGCLPLMSLNSREV